MPTFGTSRLRRTAASASYKGASLTGKKSYFSFASRYGHQKPGRWMPRAQFPMLAMSVSLCCIIVAASVLTVRHR